MASIVRARYGLPPTLTRDQPDARQDFGREEGRDEHRIELRSARGSDRANAVIEGLRSVVPATMRDGVERVGDGDDARLDGNVFGNELARVPRSIPALVVREHTVGQVGIEEGQRLEDLGASLRVRRDQTALLRRHLGVVIVHDIEERFVNLPNIVEERDALDAPDGGLIEPRGTRECHAIDSDASHVRSRHGVVRIDGVEQSLERGGGEACRPLGLAMLPNEERPNTGAEGEKNRLSHGEERGKNRTEHF